ncbi:TRAP transporter substrate-binding protein [Devosia sp. BSSL-BM10]|uniref:TRAP transporter substrate-binding protein n=1 Tax=Devosia litorisediminis TaxID=2829817 RepID=A0A942EAR0_9HYPH|nr:TRAP transporter substrate-binding protein [Devosia litorisediminis]MBS3848757.1 TRAP transporter substrate-binding protein [Devosia litorisediminis]
MANTFARLAALAGGVILATTALTSVASAQAEFVLKLHHFLGPKAPAQTAMLEPWAQRIEEASGGRVEIEIYPSMSLGGTPPELIRQVRDGIVDMVWTLNGYSPGLFPRTEVFELPFVHINDPIATNLAIASMFDEYLAEEHVGVKVLFSHVHAGQALQMVKKEIHSPDDLAGLTMRIPTRTGAWVVEALGANPVSMPVPDLPQALSRGVVDGALIPWEIIPALQLQDLTDYQIELAAETRLGTSVFQVSMNQDRWNSLPEDIQQVFLDNSGEDWLREVGSIWRNIDNGGIKVATDAGNQHIMLTPQESAVFAEKLEPVIDRWVDEVSGQGIDGDALVEAARAAVAGNL